jgi:hypothetical protein
VTLLQLAVTLIVLGLDPVAAALTGYLFGFAGYFQHWNVRTVPGNTPASVVSNGRRIDNRARCSRSPTSALRSTGRGAAGRRRGRRKAEAEQLAKRRNTPRTRACGDRAPRALVDEWSDN